jgi:hypothetical protein
VLPANSWHGKVGWQHTKAHSALPPRTPQDELHAQEPRFGNTMNMRHSLESAAVERHYRCAFPLRRGIDAALRARRVSNIPIESLISGTSSKVLHSILAHEV